MSLIVQFCGHIKLSPVDHFSVVFVLCVLHFMEEDENLTIKLATSPKFLRCEIIFKIYTS